MSKNLNKWVSGFLFVIVIGLFLFSANLGLVSAAPGDGPVGWAAVNYLGQNGTTGGAGGPVIDIYDYTTFKAQAKVAGPKILMIHGTINSPTTADQINVMSNISIIGAGSGAYINFGLKLRGNNIIIRNMDIWNGGQGDDEGHDGVGLGNANHHIWVDHCTIHECLDGAFDPAYNCRFVTASYCHFYKQNKTMLICGNDGDSKAIAAQKNTDFREWHYTVTVHHCWFEGTDQRHPRVRNGAVHCFNNYIDNTGLYGIGRGDNANIYSEANYFLNSKDAFATYDDKNHPGYVEDVNSLFEGNNGTSKENPPTGYWAWKPSQYYSYTPHSAQWVKLNLKNYAGVGKATPTN
ncbi:MAG TPA: hypothetical protein VEC37_04290 [Bacillota bacterium]|nr:hypothetical protein [Bacillota bacterium]